MNGVQKNEKSEVEVIIGSFENEDPIRGKSTP